MTPLILNQSSAVPPDEIQRRLHEYRRIGYERKAMQHGVYQEPFIACPWPGCGFRIAAVDFQIEKTNDQALYSQVISAWWLGSGIVARCPGCRQYVLFSMTQKRQATDLTGLTVLPDDWHRHAYVVP